LEARGEKNSVRDGCSGSRPIAPLEPRADRAGAGEYTTLLRAGDGAGGAPRRSSLCLSRAANFIAFSRARSRLSSLDIFVPLVAAAAGDGRTAIGSGGSVAASVVGWRIDDTPTRCGHGVMEHVVHNIVVAISSILGTIVAGFSLSWTLGGIVGLLVVGFAITAIW